MSQALTCLITDGRYSVPTLSFYLAGDAERARELAIADLRMNPHHEAVEFRRGDEVLLVLRREDLPAEAMAAE